MTGGGGQLLFIGGVVILQVGLGLVRGLGILEEMVVSEVGGGSLVQGITHTCDGLDKGVFFGDLFTLKVLLRRKKRDSVCSVNRLFICY